jgi:hypothetical protein
MYQHLAPETYSATLEVLFIILVENIWLRPVFQHPMVTPTPIILHISLFMWSNTCELMREASMEVWPRHLNKKQQQGKIYVVMSGNTIQIIHS